MVNNAQAFAQILAIRIPLRVRSVAREVPFRTYTISDSALRCFSATGIGREPTPVCIPLEDMHL